MGTTTNIWIETIKACPNEEEHLKALVAKMKANPDALLRSPFTSRHKERAFCDQCGTKLIDKTIEHENEICECCGEDVYPSDFYCPHCGDKIH